MVIKTIYRLHLFNVWVCFPALLLIILCDIGLRTFANLSLSWSHEILGLFLLTIFVLGLPYCVVKGDLLHADFFGNGNNEAGQQRRFGSTLIALFGLFFSWQGFRSVIDMLQYEDRLHTLPIPHWPFALLILFSGLLIFLYKVLSLIKSADQPSKPYGDDA